MPSKRQKHRRSQALAATAAATPARLATHSAASSAAALPDSRSQWIYSVAIFLVALALRLVHIWQIRKTPFFDVLMGDARAYDDWGQRIAAGDWIGKDVFYQAPLYPYFLGIIYATLGRGLLLIRVCQAIVGALSCVLLGLAGRRLFTARTGLIAGLALAIYAPAIFFDALLQKSVLDEFFICLMIWIAAGLIASPGRRRSWFWLGLATGGLSLTRENALVFVAVIVIWAIWPRPAIDGLRLRLAPFLLGLAIVLLPVAWRNNMVGGGFYLTTSQFGPNFFMGNNEHADGTAMSLRPGRGSPEYERQDATDIAQQARGRPLTPGEVSSYWTEQSIAFIKEHPAAWTRLQLRKVVLLWNATEILDTESQESYAEYSTPLRVGGIIGHFGVLVPLALLGLMITWPERRRLWPLYAMLVAYAASVVMFYIYARYRYPLVPLLLVFAARALADAPAFFRSLASGGWRGLLGAQKPAVFGAKLAALTAVIVFTNWSIVSADMNRTVTEHNLGAALQSAGRMDEALAAYRRAIAIAPDYAPAYSNIGTVLQAEGHLDEAIAAYEKALAILPGFSDVHYNLANAYLAKNDPVRAAEHFKVAAKAGPGSADVHNNLGNALVEQGKFAEAVSEYEKAVQFDPMSAKAHRNLGNTLASAGRPREGLDHLLRATQLDPKDAAARYDFGSLLLEGNRISDAITEFRAALAVAPDMVEAHNNLGIALGSAGRFDESIAEFRQALRLKPDFADAQRNLQMTLQARRQAAPQPRGKR